DLARALVGGAIHHHQTVEAPAAATEIAARLLATSRDPPGSPPAGPERSGYRHATPRRNRLAGELERHLPALLLTGACELARLPPKPQCSRGTSISKTSTVCGGTPSSRETASVIPRVTPAFCSGVRPGYRCNVTRGMSS